jgi:hypothetical protein
VVANTGVLGALLAGQGRDDEARALLGIGDQTACTGCRRMAEATPDGAKPRPMSDQLMLAPTVRRWSWLLTASQPALDTQRWVCHGCGPPVPAGLRWKHIATEHLATTPACEPHEVPSLPRAANHPWATLRRS